MNYDQILQNLKTQRDEYRMLAKKDNSLVKPMQDELKLVADGWASELEGGLTDIQYAQIADAIDLGIEAVKELPEIEKDIFTRKNKEKLVEPAYGASASIKLDAKEIFADIDKARGRYISDYKTASDFNRRQIIEFNYLMNEFLPRVQALLEIYPKRHLLNAIGVLDYIDEFAIPARKSGWTRAYLEMQPEKNDDRAISDIEVSEAIGTINRHLDKGEIGPASALAKRIISKIDKGDVTATASDFDWLYNIYQ